MVKEHRLRERAEGLVPHRPVKERVRRLQVEPNSKKAFPGGPWIGAEKRSVGSGAAVQEVTRDRDRGRVAGHQRRMDPTTRERRDKSGSIADEDHVTGYVRPNRSTHRNEPTPSACSAGPGEVEDRPNTLHEPLNVRPPRPTTGDADLSEPDARHHPADVPGRELRVEEDVEALLDVSDALELCFDAYEELPIDAETGVTSDPGPWSVGTNEDLSAPLTRKRTSASKIRASLLRAVGEGAQERRRVGRKKEVSGRVKVDPFERRAVQADAVDPPRRPKRQIHGISSLFDQQPGCVDGVTGIQLALPHDRSETPCGTDTGTRQSGKTGSDDLDVHAPESDTRRIVRKATSPDEHARDTGPPHRSFSAVTDP
jgi:hypothetical protein